MRRSGGQASLKLRPFDFAQGRLWGCHPCHSYYKSETKRQNIKYQNEENELYLVVMGIRGQISRLASLARNNGGLRTHPELD
jgi:hypothetical protein